MKAKQVVEHLLETDDFDFIKAFDELTPETLSGPGGVLHYREMCIEWLRAMEDQEALDLIPTIEKLTDPKQIDALMNEYSVRAGYEPSSFENYKKSPWGKP